MLINHLQQAKYYTRCINTVRQASAQGKYKTRSISLTDIFLLLNTLTQQAEQTLSLMIFLYLILLVG